MNSPAALALLTLLAAGGGPIDPAAERLHGELWRRFMHPHAAILLDHAGLAGEVILPTAEDCRLSKPNALAWGCSPEDGPMFSGFYLEAAIHRWQITGDEADAQKARRLAAGLLRLAKVSPVPGFVARGLADDGASYHLVGSNDQTFPWFYGLWRYLQSPLPAEAERREVRAELIETAAAIRDLGFQMPCAGPPFDVRGSFARFDWEAAPRLLFVLKMTAAVSGDAAWEALYRKMLDEPRVDRPGGRTRREICRGGMTHHDPQQGKRHSWTACPGVASLAGLWELESDAELKRVYLEGLRSSAAVAAESLPLALKFDNDDRRHFELDWRKANEIWRPQTSVADAVDLANKQLRLLGKISPRRGYETEWVREPAYAAWTVTLCPDKDVLRRHAAGVMAALRHYRYDRIYLSQFFPLEGAYYRLRLCGLAE